MSLSFSKQIGPQGFVTWRKQIDVRSLLFSRQADLSAADKAVTEALTAAELACQDWDIVEPDRNRSKEGARSVW